MVDTCDSINGPHGAEFTRQMILNMMSDLLTPKVQD
jgi:hypothetical protein